jgi:hypothetical protein
MLTPFTPAQVDQLRRDAQRLRKQQSLTHYDALNRIAVEHGYRNWSLLAKNSASPPPAGAAAITPTSLPFKPPAAAGSQRPKDGRQRYYLHGDQYEEDAARYYCAQCDVFFDAPHFSTHGRHTGERFLERLERWVKRVARSQETWHRPDGAPNLLEADALAARAEYQAKRQAFSDWLWAQRLEKHRTGLMARGLMTARGLPKTPKSLSQLVRHYERNGKQYFSPNTLFEAWDKFRRQSALPG